MSEPVSQSSSDNLLFVADWTNWSTTFTAKPRALRFKSSAGTGWERRLESR